MNCPMCGAPGALRVGLKLRCGNPACGRYDPRLKGVDAERPAISDETKREQLAAALTPPALVRWGAGLAFMLPAAGVGWLWYSFGRVEWLTLLGTLPFAAIGLLILLSGGAGGRIARESRAGRRLREDGNDGCLFGLLTGIGAFGVGSLLVFLFKRRVRDLFGIPLDFWPMIALVVVGALASLWGLRHARIKREQAPLQDPPD